VEVEDTTGSVVAAVVAAVVLFPTLVKIAADVVVMEGSDVMTA
jgi:hypothetical protein